MSRRSEAVKKWRKNSKERIIEAMGGKCIICGYNKCTASLSLHHLDPNKKELSFGAIRANPRAWQKIVKELRKCILVCNNCHGEIHWGLTTIPENFLTFNEEFSEYRELKKEKIHPCPVCGKDALYHNKYCSLNCSGKDRWRVDWNSINLEEEIKNRTMVSIAEQLGCSDNSVRKRLKKLGLK